MLRDSRGGRVRPDDDRQGNQEEPDRLQGRFQGAEQDPVQKARQVALRMRHMQAQVHGLLLPAAEIRPLARPKEIRGEAPQLKEGHQSDEGGVRPPCLRDQGGARGQKVGLRLREGERGGDIFADRVPLHIREEGAHLQNGSALRRDVQKEEGETKRVRLLRLQDRQEQPHLFGLSFLHEEPRQRNHGPDGFPRLDKVRQQIHSSPNPPANTLRPPVRDREEELVQGGGRVLVKIDATPFKVTQPQKALSRLTQEREKGKGR